MGQTGIEIQNTQHVLNRTFRVVITRTEEDDGYMADIPSLNSCMAFGDTVEEAMANLQEALEAYIEVMIEDGVEIPNDANLIETTIHYPISKSFVTT